VRRETVSYGLSLMGLRRFWNHCMIREMVDL
jgi:hypothetical protein